MRRREFLTLLGGTAVAWPLAARAQQTGRMRRLGVLMAPQENDPEERLNYPDLHRRLPHSVGLMAVICRRRFAGVAATPIGHGCFAKELVALQPDVILAQGTPVTAALQRETKTIPIVFVIVTDPVGDGFVAGLAHPGGNITGFLTSESAITGKMLELLTEIAPGLNGSRCCSIPIRRRGRDILLARF